MSLFAEREIREIWDKYEKSFSAIGTNVHIK